MSDKELTIDIDVNEWPLADQFAYREKTGVTPQYALLTMRTALKSGDPGDDELPDAVYNTPPEWLLGFVYVSELHDREPRTWKQLVADVQYKDLMTAIFDAIFEAVPDDGGAPDPTEPETTTDSQPETKSSPSPSSQAGRKSKSSH